MKEAVTENKMVVHGKIEDANGPYFANIEVTVTTEC